MTPMVGSRGHNLRLANAQQHCPHIKASYKGGSNGHIHQLVTPPRAGKANMCNVGGMGIGMIGAGEGGIMGVNPGGKMIFTTMVFTPKLSPEQKRGKVGQQQPPHHNYQKQLKQQRGSPLAATPLGSRSPPRPGNEEFYAGAKFSTPPAPTALPKPPSRWTLVIAGQA